jgi:asparagine synthase (glutamine-hydrolysing)
LHERALGRGIFAPASVREIVAEHDSGAINHAEKLWSLINFEIWARQFIDGENLF